MVIAHESGDSDIAVTSGTLLQFDSSNYSIPKTVTMAASEDIDYLNGQAQLSLSCPSIETAPLIVKEIDNDPAPQIIFVDAGAEGGIEGPKRPKLERVLQVGESVGQSFR